MGGSSSTQLRLNSTMADRRDVPAWLQKPTTATRYSHQVVLDDATRSPFLALSLAMRERGAILQECFLNKFYLFICDYLPDGLAGDLTHIRGDDVMRSLLCVKGKIDTAPSRHKITRSLKSTFSDLEAWMAQGKNWREAQRHAEEMNRRKGPYAPGLHSPAGMSPSWHAGSWAGLILAAMLAILIITHPDDKNRSRIVDELQIEWMLTQDRAKLDVKHGFWKGINADNVDDVFGRKEELKNEVELLVDYTTLFGPDFPRARCDIQPYLPDWAKGPVQRYADGEQHGEADGPVPDLLPFAKGDILTLRRVLGLVSSTEPPNDEDESQMLELWLFKRLASETPKDDGQSEPFHPWCRYWERRIEEAGSYQEQLLVQSLFLQSLRRLRDLSTATISSVSAVAQSEVPMDELYMVLDMDDGERRPPVPEELEQATLDFFNANPPYAALKAADTHLLSLVKDAAGPLVISCLQNLLKAQASALSHTTKSPVLNRYFHGAIAFRAARIYALVQGLVKEPLPEDRLEEWRGRRELLAQPETAAALQLTDWQLHAVLLPGSDSERVLTRRQAHMLRTRQESGGNEEDGVYGSFQPAPISCQTFPEDTFSSTQAQGARLQYDALRKLFGKVQQPPGALRPRRSETPPAAASQLAASPAPTVSTAIASATPTRRSSDNAAGLPRSVSGQKISMPPLASLLFPPKTNSPAKRTASPVDPRSAKVARLGGLRGELDDLRAQVGERLGGLAERIDTVKLEVKSLPEQLTSMQADLKKLGDKLGEADEVRAREDNERQRRLDEVTNTVKQLHEEGQEQLRDVQTDLSEIKELLGKALRRSESDLTEDCPAPVGWNQKDYESHLHRACAYYSYHAWSLTDGHGPFDADAFEETKAGFPGIDNQALLKALEHFHRQLYNCPHSWDPSELGGNRESASEGNLSVACGTERAASAVHRSGDMDGDSSREFFF